MASSKLEKIEVTVDNMGRSRVDILNKYNVKKAEILSGSNDSAKQARADLLAYIFGLSEDNPIAEASEEYYTKTLMYDDRLTMELEAASRI